MSDVHRIELTPEALRTIAAMQDRVNAIGLEYGDGSPEHVEALKSLANAYGQLLRLGGRIMRKAGRMSFACLV